MTAYTGQHAGGWYRRYVVGNRSGEFSVEFRRFGGCVKTGSLHEARIFNSLEDARLEAHMWEIKENDMHVPTTGWRALPTRITIEMDDDPMLGRTGTDIWGDTGGGAPSPKSGSWTVPADCGRPAPKGGWTPPVAQKAAPPAFNIDDIDLPPQDDVGDGGFL